MIDALGVSLFAENYLKELKEGGKIEAFYLLNSKDVPGQHNSCVEAGKKVRTLLHSTC
jgi:hypothetical protein